MSSIVNNALKYFTKSWWTTPQTRIKVETRFKGDKQAGFPEYFPQERVPLFSFNWRYIPWMEEEDFLYLDRWGGQVSTGSIDTAKEVIDVWLDKYYTAKGEGKVSIKSNYIKYP